MVTATDLGPFTATVQGSDGRDTILISLTIHLRAQTTAEKVHPSLAFETGPLHGQGLEVFHYRRVSLVDHLPIDEGVVHVVVRLVVGLALQVAAALIVVEFALQMVVIGLSVEDVVHEAVAPTAVHPVADVILGAVHPVAGALYVMVILSRRVPTGILGRNRGRDPPPVFQSLPQLPLQEPLTETVHPPF
jgi:hypothetical protein